MVNLKSNSRIHSSYVICFIVAGFIIGVWLCQFDLVAFKSIIWILIAFILSATAFVTKTRIALVIAIFSGLVFGIYRGNITINDSAQINSFIGKTMQVSGRVAEDTENTARGLSLKLKDIEIKNSKLEGILTVDTKSNVDLRRGDEIVIEGKIDKGFGSSVATIHNAKIISINQLSNYDNAIQLRDNFASKTREFISEPGSSLGLGFLIGQKNNLPSDLMLALQITGLTHIIVASGYNLTILVRITRKLFMRISKFTSTIMALLMISGFVTITGFSASMTRASIVAIINLGLWYYGRKMHPGFLILIAMAISLIFDPSFIWNNLGWQLSFLAFSGVMILAPVIQNYFYGDSKPKFINRIIIETVSATVMTAPIIIHTFGYTSTISVITNILILPLVPLAMLTTFLTGLSGFVSSWLANAFGFISEIIFNYMLYIINYFGSLDISKLSISLDTTQMLFCYLGIILVFLYMKNKTKIKLEEYNLLD